MKRSLATFLLATCAATALTGADAALAWGPTGHRATAKIAEDNVSGSTRAHIRQILGNESLDEGSTWPDEQRSNPAPFWQQTAGPFHYVTLRAGQSIEQLQHPAEGDAATALERFSAVLRDPAASREDKALALRFIVHIVSDLHNPLHVGNGTDRGGNDFVVKWFDQVQPTNLHWVWDEGMILRQQLSFTEYAERLERRTTPERVIAWWDARPATWMAESAALRDRIYPATSREAGMGTAARPALLSWNYNYSWNGVVEQRLQQAGIRVAAYLDAVFAATPPLAAAP